MVIKENISEQDSIDIQLELYNLAGMTSKKVRKARILWGVCLALGILMIVYGFKFHKLNKSDYLHLAYFFFLLGIVYCFRSIFAIIFAKQNLKSRIIKNFKKYNAVARQKYNINETYESTTEIKDGYIETSSLDTVTKFSLKDYVSKSENEKFYIFEFTNGRYIFFKKETFPNKEKYDELVNEIENRN